MPGMVAVQHSGSGKANHYLLRGFNLDHGTEYRVHLDGAPLNMRSHGNGQGYLDVIGIIPEAVDGIDYRKGPYYADPGYQAPCLTRVDMACPALHSGPA